MDVTINIYTKSYLYRHIFKCVRLKIRPNASIIIMTMTLAMDVGCDHEKERSTDPY